MHKSLYAPVMETYCFTVRRSAGDDLNQSAFLLPPFLSSVVKAQQNVLNVSTATKTHSVSLTVSDPLQLFDQRRLLPLREVYLGPVESSDPRCPVYSLRASRTSSKHSKERAKWPCSRSQHKHTVRGEHGTIIFRCSTSSCNFKICVWVLWEFSLNNKLNVGQKGQN